MSIGYFGLNETALELVACWRLGLGLGLGLALALTLSLALSLALTLHPLALKPITLSPITLTLTRRCPSGWAPTTCLWSTTRRRSMARLGLGLGLGLRRSMARWR